MNFLPKIPVVKFRALRMRHTHWQNVNISIMVFFFSLQTENALHENWFTYMNVHFYTCEWSSCWCTNLYVSFLRLSIKIFLFFVVKLVIWIWKEWNIMNLYFFGKLNKCSVMLENIFTIVCLIKYKVHSV